MITCVECGTANRIHARFCFLCGAKLEAPASDARTAVNDEPFSDVELPAGGATASPDKAEDGGGESQAVRLGTQPEAESADAGDIGAKAGQTVEPTAAHDTPVIVGAEADLSPEELLAMASLGTSTEPSAVPDLGEEDDEDSGEVAGTAPGETGLPIPKGSMPLAPGSRLGDRYEIVELVSQTTNTLIYDALDAGRCSQCGYADSQAGDVYCAQCGASLEEGRAIPRIRLCALRLEGEAVIQLEDETEGRVEGWFEDDGQLYAIMPLATKEQEESPPPVVRGMRHIVGYSSDAGLQRELDEDAILALTVAPMFEGRVAPSLGLYAVADGMGGHESGEIASRLAIEGLAETVLTRLFVPELAGEPVPDGMPADLLLEAVHSINAQIYARQQATGSDLGTTLTAALLRDETAVIANVGDGRTYLWRDGQLTQITSDHSLVAQLVQAGALAPDAIYTHPEKGAIYRSLGHAPEVEVDLFRQSIEPGDRLLLCCDGVWEMLRPDGIEEVLLVEPDPQRACDEIVRRANLAGGEDNISSVIVQFEPLIAIRDERTSESRPSL